MQNSTISGGTSPQSDNSEQPTNHRWVVYVLLGLVAWLVVLILILRGLCSDAWYIKALGFNNKFCPVATSIPSISKEANQELSFNGTVLSLSGGGSVDLGIFLTKGEANTSLQIGEGAKGATGATGTSGASASCSDVFCQGGNSFGTTATIGTNDNQSLIVETNGAASVEIDPKSNFIQRRFGDATATPMPTFDATSTSNLVIPNNFITTINHVPSVSSTFTNSSANLGFFDNTTLTNSEFNGGFFGTQSNTPLSISNSFANLGLFIGGSYDSLVSSAGAFQDSTITNSDYLSGSFISVNATNLSHVSGSFSNDTFTISNNVIGNVDSSTITGLSNSLLISSGASIDTSTYLVGIGPGITSAVDPTNSYSIMGNDSGGTNSLRLGFNGQNSWTNFTGGNLGVGTNTPANKLDVTDVGDDTPASFTGTSGTCTVDTNGGSLSCVSDQKLKTNILSISNGLDIVNQLQGVTYNWKVNPNGPEVSGFIAQDVQKVLPNLVTTLPDGTLTLNKDGIMPYIVEAVKQQSGNINDVNKQLADHGVQINLISEELKKLTNTVENHEQRLQQLEQQVTELKSQMNAGVTPSTPAGTTSTP